MIQPSLLPANAGVGLEHRGVVLRAVVFRESLGIHLLGQQGGEVEFSDGFLQFVTWNDSGRLRQAFRQRDDDALQYAHNLPFDVARRTCAHCFAVDLELDLPERVFTAPVLVDRRKATDPTHAPRRGNFRDQRTRP